MELTPKQQSIELIRSAKRILIASHINPDGDSFGSLIALTLALKKIDKEVVAVCADPIPEYLQFLPSADLVSQELTGAKDFIITVDLAKTDVDKLGYKRLADEKKLHIVITPTQGFFEPQDVSFQQSMARFDLAIILDCSDLESRLGSIYDNNTSLFYETPIVNIDHHISNDHFGKVNWIDLTATSTAEILVALLESLGREKPLLDSDIATALLTGITTDTGSFQNASTTPKSFTVAAQLVAAGAKQQEIVKKIYKTRPLSTLKLWGKALANVQEDIPHRFIWSTITQQDLEASGASESETSGVIDELLKTAPNIDFALLLSERKGGVHGNLRAVEKGVDVARLANLFGGGGHEAAAGFDIPNTTLAQEESSILERIREAQV
ncbi:MAG: DHH family phosphoesterase [bacterium]|nr:DHH family phosphoesterase [bacterium]